MKPVLLRTVPSKASLARAAKSFRGGATGRAEGGEGEP